VTTLTYRAVAVVAAGCLALLTAAGPAGASSIVYLDANHDVWLT